MDVDNSSEIALDAKNASCAESGHSGCAPAFGSGAVFPSIKALSEDFPRLLTERTARMLCCPVEVQFVRVARLPRQDFLSEICGCRTRFAFATNSPKAGYVWVAVGDQAARMIVDGMLGGAGKTVDSPLMTGIEQRLVARWGSLAGQVVAEIGPGLISRDLPADQESILDADGGSVYGLTYELSVGQELSTVHLFVSDHLLALEPQRQASTGPLKLTATFTAEVASLQDVESLSPGDILATDIPLTSELTVRLAGIPKFSGQLQLVDGGKAVTLTSKLGQSKSEQSS